MKSVVRYPVISVARNRAVLCPVQGARAVRTQPGPAPFQGLGVCKWVQGEGARGAQRRTLHRFIKRKKFDDELVESSLAKSSTRAKGASGVEPGRCSGSEPSSSEKKKVRDCEMRGQEPDFVFPYHLCQRAGAVQRRLGRKSGGPSPNLSCLPSGSPHFSLFPLSSRTRPPLHTHTHSHAVSASCITFCVGGIEHASILGADSLFPALLGVKITPRWHRSGPRHRTRQSGFLVCSPAALHSGVEGATSKEKTP